MHTHFGLALARARRNAGMSQADLAQASGGNIKRIGHYEQGRRLPTQATAAGFATALGLREDAFAQSLYRDKRTIQTIVVVDLERFIAGLTDAELLALRSPERAAAAAADHEARALVAGEDS